MSTHLTDEQLTALLIGEADAGLAAHIGECAECSHELAGMQTALKGFRSSVRSWAEQYSAEPQVFKTARVRRLWPWAIAGAAFAVAFLVPIYRNSNDPESEAQAAADRRLLEQIDAQLYRPIPESMQSLVELLPENTESNGEPQ